MNINETVKTAFKRGPELTSNLVTDFDETNGFPRSRVNM